MGLAHRASLSASGATAPAAAFSAVSGDLLIATFNGSAATSVTAPTISDSAGGSWSQLQSYAPVATQRHAMWVRDTAAPSTGTLTVTFGATYTGGTTTAVGTVSAFSGAVVYGTSAVAQSTTNSGAASGTPAATFSSNALTGNATIGSVSGQTLNSVTPPTNWTEQLDAARNAAGDEIATRDSGFTGTTITWGATVANAWGVIIAELQALVSVALTGQAVTGSVGTLTPANSTPLTGQAGTSSLGTLVPTITVPLTGISASALLGTLSSVGGDKFVTLTGVSGTMQQGTLTPTLSAALTGLVGTTSTGNLIPVTSIPMTGVAGASALGSVTLTRAVPLTGVQATGAVGSVQPPPPPPAFECFLLFG